MLLVTILLSVLFVAVGFLINRTNARYLLAGYNTMSEAERATVDIDAYLHFFRRFHLFLGLSLLGLVLLFHFFISKSAAGILLAVYPMAAYLYLLLRGNHFNLAPTRSRQNWVLFGALILVVPITGVCTLFYVGLKESQLLVHPDTLEITGMYGERIAKRNLQSVQLTNELPGITAKTNGFSLGEHKKGYFRTSGGKKVKLIINDQIKPYLKISTNQGDVYFSSSASQPDELYRRIQESGLAQK